MLVNEKGCISRDTMQESVNPPTPPGPPIPVKQRNEDHEPYPDSLVCGRCRNAILWKSIYCLCLNCNVSMHSHCHLVEKRGDRSSISICPSCESPGKLVHKRYSKTSEMTKTSITPLNNKPKTEQISEPVDKWNNTIQSGSVEESQESGEDTEMKTASGNEKDDATECYTIHGTPFISPDYVQIIAKHTCELHEYGDTPQSPDDDTLSEESHWDDDNESTHDIEALFNIGDPVNFITSNEGITDQPVIVQHYIVTAKDFHIENNETELESNANEEAVQPEQDPPTLSGWYYKLKAAKSQTNSSSSNSDNLLLERAWFYEDELEFYCEDEGDDISEEEVKTIQGGN